MKLFRWEHGRQNGGYSKFTLAFSKRLKFDCYIIRLPVTSVVPHHRDPAPEGFEHHRVNITLRSAKVGGTTFIACSPERPGIGPRTMHYEEAPKVYHFRPDLYTHFMSAIMKGEVWLLSFGWLRRAQAS